MQQGTNDIYYKYANDVKRFLICLTHQADLAEDLTQETFYQAYKSIHRYNGTCKMSVWLCQIARHVYYDYLKKNKHLKTVSMDCLTTFGYETPSSDTLEETYITKEQIRSILNLIEEMKSPYGEVFLLRIFDELPYKEIGQIYEKSENWARVTYYRAKEMIKERMEHNETNM